MNLNDIGICAPLMTILLHLHIFCCIMVRIDLIWIEDYFYDIVFLFSCLDFVVSVVHHEGVLAGQPSQQTHGFQNKEKVASTIR